MSKEAEDSKNDARATLYLPSDLLEWVKVRAAKERKRANAIMVEALEKARRESSDA